MIDLKQLFDAYNLCARFAPGFLFVVALIFLNGEKTLLFQDNSPILITLIIILSGVSGFISASFIKFIEQSIWKHFGNPVICHLKRNDKKLYLHLRKEHGEKEIVGYMKKITRGDDKLLWKNIAYGFFRNSIPLSLLCLLFSYASKYFYFNVCVVILVVTMTCFCSYCYAHQIIESYKENFF